MVLPSLTNSRIVGLRVNTFSDQSLSTDRFYCRYAIT